MSDRWIANKFGLFDFGIMMKKNLSYQMAKLF